MRSLLLIFLFLFLLTSCKKFTEAPEKKCFIPYVDFVAQHVDPSTLEVTFSTVTSYNGIITTYKWDFGDGTTFDGQTPPPHKYPSANGSAHYKVKLTVANDCGEAYWTQDVTISACLPDTKFSFRYVNDSTVEFTNQTKTGSNTSYLWNFGDGTTGNNTQTTFTHIYKDDKPFVVSLKATNACGDNNYTETIAVCRKPEASQTVSINSCGVVTIDASGSKNAIKYQWDMGNGTVLPATPTTSPTLSYTYPNAGNYTITLKVFNAAGCDSATTSKNVSVAASALATNSNWNYTSDDLDFVFTRDAIANAVSYKWDFGDGTAATVQNPSHTYANPGAYTVKLSATGSCGSTYEFSAQINAPYYNVLKNLPEAGFQQVVALSPSLIYYLGTSGKLYRTDTSGNWAAINLPSGLPFNTDTKLYTDHSNNLWIYGRKDVERLNTNGTSWTSYFSNTGLANNTTIDAIAIDNNNEVWTISGGVLRKGSTIIHSSVAFSSLAYAPGTNRIWLTSPSSAGLYYINTNSTQLNPVSNTSITGGGDDIQIAANGDIYVTTSTGIVRMNSSGSAIASFNSGTTNGLISGRPSAYDFDAQGNMWVLLSGQLYKVPLGNAANTKKYSFNADLSNISSISVLDLSGTDSDILLAKTSGNAAIKIR
ncbi:MAG: PKD domain-containing protein [Flavisolibacter sp.]